MQQKVIAGRQKRQDSHPIECLAAQQDLEMATAPGADALHALPWHLACG